MIRIDHQEVMTVRALPFLCDIRRFHSDPLHLIEILIQDHTLSRGVSQQPVVVKLIILIMVTVVSRTIHIVFFEIPETCGHIF